MKVLQLGKFHPPDIGGMETVIYDIAECLNKSGIECDVLCSNSAYEYKEEIINGYKVFRTKTFGNYFSTSITPQMIFKLRDIISEYDIIHVHLPDPMANLSLFFANIKNKKIVIHWHSDIIKQKYLLKLYEPLQKWLLNKADKIIATTPKYMEESKYLKNYKEKCVVIPIGIDENRLNSDPVILNKLKKKYRNKKIIFSLGRLSYYKGFEYLINSAKYLDDSYMILIGGDGELKNKLQKIIDNEKLNDKVELLGKIAQSELGSYFQFCNVFCLPSIAKSEAFGVAQIEAMRFGKPIVATKIKGSGVDWVNQHGVTGLNVDFMNSKQLAQAFIDILKNDILYNKLKEGAKTRFINNFKRSKMVSLIIKLYNELL